MARSRGRRGHDPASEATGESPPPPKLPPLALIPWTVPHAGSSFLLACRNNLKGRPCSWSREPVHGIDTAKSRTTPTLRAAMTTSCLTVFPVPAATPVSSHPPKMSPFAFLTVVLHLARLFIAQRLHLEPIDDPDRDADFPFVHVAARDIVAVEVFQALRFVFGYVPADQSIGIRREG
ncbi:unnamed protein product [Miscanthus lutarioriparius]|uniref:Uncharacterized protein n=1 Tax=Miscanthus lutarioriparius TaxID=422564 RepID=A0A811Q4G2_9POAL|nr:unnamed protein product [Miscanthus lutarioriparius]